MLHTCCFSEHVPCAACPCSDLLPIQCIQLPTDCSHTCRDNAGETDWDAVIDAEMARRKLLEESPIPCSELFSEFVPLSPPPPCPRVTGVLACWARARTLRGRHQPFLACSPHLRTLGCGVPPCDSPSLTCPPPHPLLLLAIAAANEDPVLFDTAEIPWWAWVRRFHLPEVSELHVKQAPASAAEPWQTALVGSGGNDAPSRIAGSLIMLG